MEKRSPIDLTWVALGAVVLLAAGGAVALLWWTGVLGGQGGSRAGVSDSGSTTVRAGGMELGVAKKSPKSASGLADAFRYDLGALKKIDPALIKYRQTATIPVGLKQARAIAVGPEDRVYVAGDKAVQVFDAKGARRGEFAVGDAPRCITVAGPKHAFPGRVYVGMTRSVEVYDPAGKRLAAWEDLGSRAVVTSIAAGQDAVFVADAGNRVVYRYDPSGKRRGEIGKRDPAKDAPGFVIPSPHFHLAMAPDGRLRVVNPGRLRIETYTLDGVLDGLWGEAGMQIERFCGCCNPVSFAMLPDGSFVTAEKGIPRVKVYDEDGGFSCVVAGPETFAPTLTALEVTRDDLRLPVLDVAADSCGRVLVLDPAAGKIRVFEPKPVGNAAARKGA